MINTMTGYRLIAADLPRSLARVSKEPMVQRDSDYYLKNIGKVKSIDDFMKDTKLVQLCLESLRTGRHGLSPRPSSARYSRKASRIPTVSPTS